MRSRLHSLAAWFTAQPSTATLSAAGQRNLCRMALLLALFLAWSFAFAPVALAATSPIPPAVVKPSIPDASVSQLTQMLVTLQQQKARQALVQQEMAEHAGVVGPAPVPTQEHLGASPHVTLLDEVGQRAH